MKRPAIFIDWIQEETERCIIKIDASFGFAVMLIVFSLVAEDFYVI